MGTTPFKISLASPQTYRINMNQSVMQAIGLTTPVAYGTAKLSIDTTANWNLKVNYVPKKGEIVVYSDRYVIDDINYPGIKIGDGLAYLIDLPFFGDDRVDYILGLLFDHINDTDAHVTPEKREFWDNKLNFELTEETLILNRE